MTACALLACSNKIHMNFVLHASDEQGLGMRLGPHHTTLLITQSMETPLTLPAQWAGSQVTYPLHCLYYVLSAF